MNMNGEEGEGKSLIKCPKCGYKLIIYAPHIYVCNNCGNVEVDERMMK